MSNGAASTEEQALVVAWAGGDRQAGRTLIAANYDAIVRFFRTKAGPEADDLVQRTFLRCSERIHTFEGTGTFRAFLFGIARYVLLEHIRSRTRDRRNQPDFNVSSMADLQPGVWTQALARRDKRDLVAALQMIPVDAQILLELYYWEELGIAELSEALEIPGGTVKSRLHRARQQLQDAIGKVPTHPDDARSATRLLDSWRARIRQRSESTTAANTEGWGG